MACAWKAEAIWRGETCAILAGGPSMSQEIADSLRGKCRVIVVNDTYKLAPWADVLYAADWQWWNYHVEAQKFAGMRVGIYPVLPHLDILYLLNGGYGGIDYRRTHLRTGKNGGFQAVHLAYHFGAKQILLCGFDMRDVNGKAHWHGEHPKQVNKERPYATWIKLFTHAAPLYVAHGISIINCTPDSALHCFKKRKLEDVLESLCTDTRSAVLSA